MADTNKTSIAIAKSTPLELLKGITQTNPGYEQWRAQHERAVKTIADMAKLRGNFRMTMAPIKKPSPEELRARMDFMKGLDIRGYLAAHPESKQTYESMMAKIQKAYDICSKATWDSVEDSV